MKRRAAEAAAKELATGLPLPTPSVVVKAASAALAVTTRDAYTHALRHAYHVPAEERAALRERAMRAEASRAYLHGELHRQLQPPQPPQLPQQQQQQRGLSKAPMTAPARI